MSKQFLHMQKLAGLITESEYKTKLEENTNFYKLKDKVIYLEHNKILLKENFYEEELLENVVSSLWEHLKKFVLKKIFLIFASLICIAFTFKNPSCISKANGQYFGKS